MGAPNMAEPDVKHTLRRLEAGLSEYPSQIMAAAVRSLNRTIFTVRKEAATAMARDLPGLKIGTIKRQLKLLRATRTRPTAILQFSEKRFRLFGNFVTRQTKTGVPLRRVPWRIENLEGEPISADQLRHAFIQRSHRGAVNVWLRTSLVGKRYPITALVAPSLASAFVARGIGARLIASGRARFAVVFDQEATYRIGKLTQLKAA